MVSGRLDEAGALEAANTALYAALESGDLDLLGAVWLDGPDADTVVCVHPGWSPLRGRTDVLRSFVAIMAGTPYIQFFVTDQVVTLRGDVGVVSCTASVLTGLDDPGSGAPSGFAGGRVAATNVFRRTPSGWRLWSHHASPVIGDGEGSPFSREGSDEGGTDGDE